ncbi:MAG: hypothetical protein JWQ47_2140 [Glaciihabitans sp.]|nr:hypothetical protein [Glaciihabitans sp.]
MTTTQQVKSKAVVSTRSTPTRASTKTAVSPTAKTREKDESVYIARMAVALLCMPDKTEPLFTVPAARLLASEVELKFREALKGDLRVLDVLLPGDKDEDTDNATVMRYLQMDESESNIQDAVRRVPVMRLNSPIRFRVRVPAKNQPKYRSRDDVPSDDYLVWWNGIVVVVQWEMKEPRATGSGGHIVLQILEEVGSKVGHPVEIVPCSTGCHHRFIHGDFVTFAGTKAPDHFYISGETPVGKTVITPFVKPANDLTALNQASGLTETLIEYFARAKTFLDAIWFLEHRARDGSDKILEIAYARARKRRFPHLLGWTADTFALIGSRRETKALVAELWLALISIDNFKVNWRTSETSFRHQLDDTPLAALDELFDTGRAYVESLDLDLIRSSLQEVSTRMDGRMIAIATIAGGIAGIAGAALAALFT